MIFKVLLIIFFCLISNTSLVFCSEGDRLQFYQKCLRSCTNINCTEDGAEWSPPQEAECGLLWNCRDDCRYHCMWVTVDTLKKRYQPMVMFHGKWPFKRILCVQEPASVLFSVLNLAAHVCMYLKIVRDRRFKIGETPMLMFWHIFFVVCAHGWLWSTIFHTRDTPFTEFMDYTCALSMVLALFVAAVQRVFRKQRVLTLLTLTCTLLYYVQHVKYLYRGFVDYEYNMIVNVCFGAAGSLLWLSWSLLRLHRGERYPWRMAAFVLASAAALLLELGDFRPVLHVDAHALWHLATAPLPLCFYRFVIDDMDYLQTTEMVEKKAGVKAA